MSGMYGGGMSGGYGGGMSGGYGGAMDNSEQATRRLVRSELRVFRRQLRFHVQMQSEIESARKSSSADGRQRRRSAANNAGL